MTNEQLKKFFAAIGNGTKMTDDPEVNYEIDRLIFDEIDRHNFDEGGPPWNELSKELQDEYINEVRLFVAKECH